MYTRCLSFNILFIMSSIFIVSFPIHIRACSCTLSKDITIKPGLGQFIFPLPLSFLAFVLLFCLLYTFSLYAFLYSHSFSLAFIFLLLSLQLSLSLSLCLSLSVCLSPPLPPSPSYSLPPVSLYTATVEADVTLHS